jgi:hypothetical protein
VLFGSGAYLAYRMSSLLPKPHGCGTRDNAEKRQYVFDNVAAIEYRTRACGSRKEATECERDLNKNSWAYLFPT